MGAHPYFYFVEHQGDVDAALQELRQREFDAGRYNPVEPFLDFPLGPDSPAPGAKHESIEEAMEAADADGTRSILDIEAIGEEPNFGTAVPLREDELEQYFGTTQPTHDMVADNMDFLEDIERGHCIYITVYKEGKPSELFFAGYSFD
jgi:hypothetical protein